MDWENWKKSKFWRAMRRFGAVFIVGGLSALGVYLTDLPANEKTATIVIATAIVLMAEKYIRDYFNEIPTRT